MAKKKKKRKSAAAESHTSERTEAQAWKDRREWASKNRYYIAGGVGVAALAYLWPREAQATVAVVPPPVVQTLTPEQVVALQTSQQEQLGRSLGIAAFALVAAGTLYYITK